MDFFAAFQNSVANVCGTDSNFVYEWVAGRTDNGTLPVLAAWLVDRPLRILFILFVAWTTAFFMVFAELGVSLGPLIASAGIAGIALGFGAQTTTEPSEQFKTARIVRVAVKKAFDAEGIEIPFDQQVVWLHGGNSAAT